MFSPLRNCGMIHLEKNKICNPWKYSSKWYLNTLWTRSYFPVSPTICKYIHSCLVKISWGEWWYIKNVEQPKKVPHWIYCDGTETFLIKGHTNRLLYQGSRSSTTFYEQTVWFPVVIKEIFLGVHCCLTL